MGTSTERGDTRRWILRNMVEWLCALLMIAGPLATMGLDKKGVGRNPLQDSSATVRVGLECLCRH